MEYGTVPFSTALRFWRGRAALREAFKGVRELYDRLGTEADGGLGEVVHAVRKEKAAALRQVDALQRRIEGLDGQVTHLAERYGTFAPTSPDRWI